ncbi:MAG: putative DNA binding domain-containing protein [Bacteroidaceae bacterium]|nr:putative DNA binding domain-containing protein [Bacteroidaceae bacterium]
MKIQSQYQPFLTVDYIVKEDENKLFDRKSSKVKPTDIAPIISAFANAEGGTVVIGVAEKTREIEGIDGIGNDSINDLIAAPKDVCIPMPHYKEEFLDVINKQGKADRLLLLHIEPSPEQVVRTINNSTYLRVGDRTKELKGEDLRNLEYSKSVRHYEDECHPDASIEDLDKELLSIYREKLHAEDLSYEELLKARGFLKQQKGSNKLTNAAVLLFAKNIVQFYPNCRIRFVRYDGTKARTGVDINIIRDQSIELPVLRIIQAAKTFIGSQLREFTALDTVTGKFQIVPEYPEFAWLEGIVNAVTHREYAMSGRYILVSMYDDRLEIESPGKLPSVVTVDNIKETRYSRNPRIARLLTDFGWVRELNEGVKRIYSDMKKFFLDDPIYSEPEQSVRLVLKNNIVMRNLRRKDRAAEFVGEDIWSALDENDRHILVYMSEKREVTRLALQTHLKRSNGYITRRLARLIDIGIVRANGNTHDPKRTYSIICRE